MTDHDLSPETRTLLSRGRDGHVLSGSRRKGLKRAVLTQVAAGGVLATSTTAAAWTTVGVKLAGVAVVALAVGGGVHAIAGSGEARDKVAVAKTVAVPRTTASSTDLAATPPRAEPARELPSPQAGFVPPTSSVPAPSSMQLDNSPPPATAARPPAAAVLPISASLPGVTVTYSSPAPSAIPPARPPGSPSLHADARLLLDADAKLKAGDAVAALRLLDEHAKRFPESVLEPERSAERIVALCEAGRVADAQRETRTFLSGHSAGPLVTRVQGSCGAR